MDASRFVGLVFLTLSFVLLSNQLMSDDDNNAECPLQDNPITHNGTTVHNITRTVRCINGRNMAGCCVLRIYCDFNTSNIDLSLYGKPGFKMHCSDVCCPMKYILPISLPNSTKDDNNSSSDSSNSSFDSDSNDYESV